MVAKFGDHFSGTEWNEVRRHLKPTDDEGLLRSKLDWIAWRYLQVLWLSKNTNPDLAEFVKKYQAIGQTAGLLKNQLSNFRGAHIGFELDVAARSDVEFDNFFRDNAVPVTKAAALFSLLYEDLSSPLSLAVDYAKRIVDLAEQFAEPINGKHAVVLAIVDHWVKDMQRPFPKSGGGTLAQFVFAAANPILRMGGQQIATVGATRTMLLTMGPPKT
jgi:hypothetical protein